MRLYNLFRSNPAFPVLCLAVGLSVFGVSYTLLGLGQGGGASSQPVQSDGERLMHAIVGDDDEKLKALLEAGSDPNEIYPAVSGMLPLQMAIRGDTETTYRKVKLLLDHGANPNALDHRNKTPMHTAARFGSEPVMKILMDAGGDPTIATTAHLTPHEEAIANGNKGAVAAISEKGFTLADKGRMDELRIGAVVAQGLKGVFSRRSDLTGAQRKAQVKNTVNKLVGEGLMDESSAEKLYQRIVKRLRNSGLIKGRE